MSTSQWFTEEDGGVIRYGYAFEREIFHAKSEFQDVRVIETKAYGKMLIIDGFVMLTEADEFVYHEMISHVPVCYHTNPEVVIVIGGGDGGTVRELLRHPGIKKIVLCEIDKMVVDASRKYFPEVACGLDDPRVEVRIGDGIGYMKELSSVADIVIVDSTDPVGPGEGLFTGEFYRSVARALKEDGLMVAQSESPWASGASLQRIYQNISRGFSCVRPYTGPVPTYPRGLWSWTMAANWELSRENFNGERFATVRDGCQYLTENSAKNAFEIPNFYRSKLNI